MNKIEESNVLVVGAGGIGCELLKTMVMWKFRKITVIDLDTIDVSNLNRQFLFRKEHVGKSKSLTAKESVLKFNNNVEITALCDDILSAKFNVDFYKTFNVVLNALDNKTARNHVNRMCLRAEIPLVEGGTTGYRGQVQPILKNKTACYECFPKPAQKQYPACTIRNTPSEPIHCVVWAKFLFNQLFGEPDADEDVVPDQNDPELAEQQETSIIKPNGDDSTTNNNKSAKNSVRQAWRNGAKFDSDILLRILFVDNINSLLSMKVLWTKNNRVKPTALSEENIKCDVKNVDKYLSQITGGVRDQNLFNLTEWCQIFKHAAVKLSKRDDDSLIWDKDDVEAMDFVAAAANIRMSLFNIEPLLNRFQIKSMAGNIIPAIATTNAIIAGISVLQAYKIINNQTDECRDVMLSELVSARGKIIQSVEPQTPQSNCYSCSLKHVLMLHCNNISDISLKALKKCILENKMSMMAPNVSIQNKSTLLIDGGEEDEDLVYLAKTLDQFGLENGSVLRCSDFLQTYEFSLVIVVDKSIAEWQLHGNIAEVKSSARPEEEEEPPVMETEPTTVRLSNDRKRKLTNDNEDQMTGHNDYEVNCKKMKIMKSNDKMEDDAEDEDDLVMIS